MRCTDFFVCLAFLIGTVTASLKSRIIGGEYADIINFPYTVSIRARGKHICGGCIISTRHILTAAHCITANRQVAWPSPHVTVHTGTSSLEETGLWYYIHTYMIHPGWPEGKSNVNDVAVIMIAGEISFNPRQQKLELPDHNVISDTKGNFTGWGFTSVQSNQNSIQLKKLELILLTNRDCQPYHRNIIDQRQLCAFQRAGHGTCYGDSGGPLVIGNQVVGILSWVTTGSFATASAEIYTNIYAHKRFIETVMTYHH